MRFANKGKADCSHRELDNASEEWNLKNTKTFIITVDGDYSVLAQSHLQLSKPSKLTTSRNDKALGNIAVFYLDPDGVEKS
jgi:hypothetical protein